MGGRACVRGPRKAVVEMEIGMESTCPGHPSHETELHLEFAQQFEHGQVTVEAYSYLLLATSPAPITPIVGPRSETRPSCNHLRFVPSDDVDASWASLQNLFCGHRARLVGRQLGWVSYIKWNAVG